ncbi:MULTISPECIES: hypothetical protein [Kitasatospora]|uniref:Leucine rich repeat variant n=1 Tax=Kitasatospora setae (strain ATCC 33774 / DSM 43861 / JCM 3304 / KCC A-0304 / NBRC 14216 / KM-6054) TaxID=452652 RepID=E4N7W5_KITSK|nr:hypothetical protein KSE_14680 [Kitasatospora setae KM-6054]
MLTGLAANPALPADLVDRLLARTGGRYTRQLAARTDLTAGQLATLLERHPTSTVLHQPLPRAEHHRLADHPDERVRVALVRAGAPDDRHLWERLAADPSPRVRTTLAESDRTPADLRARLARDPDPEVRAALAQWWPDAPEPVRRILLTDPEERVRAAACARYFRRLPHPVPPADLVPALLADPPTRAGAVPHCDPDTTDLDRLAADPDPEVRRALATHPRLPAAIRDRLAADPRATVRLAVFARPDTPDADRAALHDSLTGPFEPPGEDVDEETAIEIEIDRFEIGVGLWLLHLPWATADPLPHLDSPYAVIRRSAARAPGLPTEARARLLADPDNEVALAAAASSPDPIDLATAERLDREHRPPKRMHWRPADSHPLPVTALRRLATDPEPRMRQLALRDSELPAHLLERLAADPEQRVRHTAASHPGLTPASPRPHCARCSPTRPRRSPRPPPPTRHCRSRRCGRCWTPPGCDTTRPAEPGQDPARPAVGRTASAPSPRRPSPARTPPGRRPRGRCTGSRRPRRSGRPSPRGSARRSPPARPRRPPGWRPRPGRRSGRGRRR